MNLCNIPLATTLTCVVCMFKNLMKIRMTVINTLYFTIQIASYWVSITAAYKKPNVFEKQHKS